MLMQTIISNAPLKKILSEADKEVTSHFYYKNAKVFAFTLV